MSDTANDTTLVQRVTNDDSSVDTRTRLSAYPEPRAWVLNLDAELELRNPERYQPTKGTLAACRHFETLARSLIGPSDIVLSRDVAVEVDCAANYRGAAWCPTPSALALLRRARANVPVVPTLESLRLVNHRRFHAELGQTLPDACFAPTLDEARAGLSRPVRNGWLVKRGFGFAGRGNRRFPSVPSPDDWRWLEHALRDGGVQIEPWLTIVREYSQHAYLAPDGQLDVGWPCVLQGRGSSYIRVGSDPEFGPEEANALLQQVMRVGEALHDAGYFGPVGLDAFSYEWGVERRFNPRSEINARYTLAYAVGMGNA